MRICSALILLSLPLVSWAQTCAVTPPPEPVSIDAKVAEYAPPQVHAVGNVLFKQGQKRLRADELCYDLLANTGVLTNVSFTTCDSAHPDYLITAREIRLTPDQHLRAKHVGIYLGNYHLLSLPRLSMNIGPNQGPQTIFPRPGYSNNDGFFISANYPMITSDKTDVNLLLRPTTRSGIQGGVTGGYAIRGSARVAAPYVPETDIALRHQSILIPLIENGACTFPEAQPQHPVFAAFGAALYHQRAYNVNEPNLRVTRLPEVGIRYVSPRECVGSSAVPIIGVQADGRLSWGRFEETPSSIGFEDRLDARGIASTTLKNFGPYTALRGSGLARYSSYSTGEAYKVLGGALDISRIYPGGSFGSIRLIGYLTSGTTPFQFDSIDIRNELEGVGRYVLGRNTYGLLLRYDLDDNSLRDWEIYYARRLHCLEPSINWRHRFRQISLNVRVLGF